MRTPIPMKLHRPTHTLFALFTLTLLSCSISLPSTTSKAEIRATATWFESLEWPDLRGKPYVEIIFGKRRIGSKVEEGPRVRGFLLTEDNPSFRVFSDGAIAQSNFFSAGGWPFVVQRIPKSSPDTDVDSKITNRVIELSDAVKELLAEPLSRARAGEPHAVGGCRPSAASRKR